MKNFSNILAPVNVPDQDPRAPQDQINYLAEEMLDWGLDPMVESQEAYIRARAAMWRGEIEPSQLASRVKRESRIRAQRDTTIASTIGSS